jgi:Putative zinc-finger
VHSRTELDAHPSLDRLIAYQENRLDPEACEEVRDHIAECPSCFQQVLDLQAFAAPASDPADLSQAREASYAARAILSEERARKWRNGLALAAGLVLALVGVVAYREMVGPERGGELMLASLYPEGDVRSTAESPAVQLSQSAPFLGLILNLADPPQCASYTALIREAQSGKVLQVTEVRVGDRGLFQVVVPTKKLAPGLFRVELEGKGGCSGLIGTFLLKIAESPDQPES